MKDLARLGAQARLRELELEIESIISMFPELRGTVARGGRRGGGRSRKADAKGTSQSKAAPNNDGPSGVRKRGEKRRGMSAAGRRAQSERMKKYWAARRKAEAKSA